MSNVDIDNAFVVWGGGGWSGKIKKWVEKLPPSLVVTL